MREFTKDEATYDKDLIQYKEEYDSAKKKRDTIDDYIQKSNTFWLDASDKIKSDITDELKEMNGDIGIFFTDLNIIGATPARTETKVKEYYDVLKDMDSNVDEMKQKLDDIFTTYVVAPALPTQITAGPSVNFKDYFLQEYNKKFNKANKGDKTKKDIAGKWSYYLTLIKGATPSKTTIDDRIKNLKN